MDFLRQENTQSPEAGLGNRLKQLQKAEIARDGTIGQIIAAVKHHVTDFTEQSNIDLAILLRKSPWHQNDFVHLLTRRVINRVAVILDGIFDENADANSQRCQIQGLIDETLEDVLRSSFSKDPEWLKNEESVQLMSRLHESWRESTYHGALAQNGATILSPLGPEDLPHLEQLYRLYLLSEEETIRMAIGATVRTPQTFIHSFDENEKDRFGQLLEQTKDLHIKKTVPQKREHETMYGMGLWNSLQNELLAASLYTVAPYAPKKDVAYLQRQEEFFEHGVSGGKIDFFDKAQRDHLEGAMKNGTSIELALIIGKIRGAARCVHAANIRQVQKLLDHSRTICSTYYLQGLHIKNSNGESVQKKGVWVGQNTKSAGLLMDVGYSTGFAKDSNDEDEVRRGELLVTPTWMHATGQFCDIKKIADQNKGVAMP